MAISICGAAIDWAATGTMLQGWGTLIGAVAVFAAAWIGANTFNSWKRQKITERHIEQAERILTAAYRARRALAQVRSPLMYQYELDAAEKEAAKSEGWAHQTQTMKARLRTAQGYFNRVNSTEVERLSLEECLPMARAIFGEATEKAVESLIRQFWAVKVHANAYISDDGSDPDFTRKIREALSASSSVLNNSDEISLAIQDAIETIEGKCLPSLSLEKPGKK